MNVVSDLAAIQDFLPLIELIYDASSDGSLWPTILDRIGDAVNGEQIAISVGSSGPLAKWIPGLVRESPEELDPHAAYFESDKLVAERCGGPFPTGTFRYRHIGDYHPERENGESCIDCRRPGICCRFGLKVPLSDLRTAYGQPIAYLTCLRCRQKGHFNDRDGAVIKTIAPHLQRALRTYIHCERAKVGVKELKSVLDSFDRAVFGLDRRGIVVLSNRRAEAILKESDGLMIFHGRLVAMSSRDDSKLQSTIARTVAGGQTAQDFSLHVTRKSEALPLQVTITSNASNLSEDGTQLAALVFVSDPAQQPRSCSAALRQLYGLTPTESRLADMLNEGLEVCDAADRLGVTIETARFHLKRALSKTGARRQAELIRLMLSLPGF